MNRSLFPEHDKPLATREEIVAFCIEQGLTENDGVYLFHHWTENKWTRNNKPLKKWTQAVLAWKAGGFLPSQRKRFGIPLPPDHQQKPSHVSVQDENDRSRIESAIGFVTEALALGERRRTLETWVPFLEAKLDKLKPEEVPIVNDLIERGRQELKGDV